MAVMRGRRSRAGRHCAWAGLEPESDMARELSDDDRDLPLGDDTTNGVSKDVFRRHLTRLIQADNRRDISLAERKTIRKEAKAAGIELGHIDQIIEMLAWEPQEIRDFIETLLKYMDLAELLPHADPDRQLELFPEMEPTERAKADWNLRGFLAGTTGKGVAGKPPSECPAERMQDWMEGWHRSQEANAAKLHPVS
jgi:ribosome modulation factor